MKLATTTGDFSKYADTVEERVKLLHECGFKHIDLSLYGKSENEPFLQDNWKEKAEGLKALAESLGMDFVQAHSVGGNPLEKNENYDSLLQSTIRDIEVCRILGIPNIVVHAGYKTGIGKEEYFKENAEFYRLLFPVMEKTGVNVLTENSCRSNMGDCYYFFTGEDMREFIDYMNHPQFFACWDTGHANIEGHQYPDITALGDKLKAIHFNDNCGEKDEHILPYTGTMSIDEVMHGLLDIGFKGPFTFEACNSLIHGRSWPYKRRMYEEDTRAYKPSLNLKMQSEKLLYAIGEEILKLYHIEVG